jgi:hypothetical protein
MPNILSESTFQRTLLWERVSASVLSLLGQNLEELILMICSPVKFPNKAIFSATSQVVVHVL